MPDPVDMTFVTTDVSGGTWLEWGSSTTGVKDMVDQALGQLKPGQCIGRLIICSHGSVGADGFMGFDNDLTGSEVIDGGTKDPIAQSVRDELGRLRGRFCPEGVIEFRVCRFGAGKNGRKALQAVADITGVNVTGPQDSIKGVMGLGGIATRWLTAHPTSTGVPVTDSFIRGDGTQPPPPPVGGGPRGGDIAEVPRYIPMQGIPAPAPPGPAIVPPGAIPTSPPGGGTSWKIPVAVGGALVAVGVAFAVTQAPTTQNAATPTPRLNAPLLADPIKASFVQSAFSTTYTSTITPGGNAWSYHWAGPNCGTSSGTSEVSVPAGSASQALTFTWSHPHPPCAATTNHSEVTVTLTITWPGGTLVCAYPGSESGTGASCKPF
ncbi:MAG TPA: hypothetical protein VGA38_10010 [Candidatus Limnocylindria bacterium]